MAFVSVDGRTLAAPLGQMQVVGRYRGDEGHNTATTPCPRIGGGEHESALNGNTPFSDQNAPDPPAHALTPRRRHSPPEILEDGEAYLTVYVKGKLEG